MITQTVFAIAVTAITLMEKISKFVIVNNIVFYLMASHDQSMKTAIVNSYIADALASTTPLLGVFIVNKFIGRRFLITVLSSIIYFMGLIVLAMSEIFPSLKAYNMTFILSGVMILLGVGGLKPCVDTIGGDKKFNVWKFLLEILLTGFFSYMVDVMEWRKTYSALGVFMIICIMMFLYMGNETYQPATPPPPKHSDVDRNSPHHINYRMLFFLWLTCMIFGVFNVQTSTLFSVQIEDMTHKSSYEISPISIYFISLVLMKPLIIFLEKMVVPFFSPTNKISILKRAVFGMILACVAMIFAAIWEKERQITDSELDTPRERIYGRIPVSVFWFLPQGMLLAASDTFIFIGVEEYLSDYVSSWSINFATIFYTSTIAAGSFLTALLVVIVNRITQELNGKSWIEKELKSSQIDKVYEFLIAIIYGPIICVLICWKFCCRTLDDAQDGVRTDPIFNVAREI